MATSINQSVYASSSIIHLYIHFISSLPSIHPPTQPHTHPPIYPPTQPHTHTHPSIHPSIHPPVQGGSQDQQKQKLRERQQSLLRFTERAKQWQHGREMRTLRSKHQMYRQWPCKEREKTHEQRQQHRHTLKKIIDIQGERRAEQQYQDRWDKLDSPRASLSKPIHTLPRTYVACTTVSSHHSGAHKLCMTLIIVVG